MLCMEEIGNINCINNEKDHNVKVSKREKKVRSSNAP